MLAPGKCRVQPVSQAPGPIVMKVSHSFLQAETGPGDNRMVGQKGVGQSVVLESGDIVVILGFSNVAQHPQSLCRIGIAIQETQ